MKYSTRSESINSAQKNMFFDVLHLQLCVSVCVLAVCGTPAKCLPLIGHIVNGYIKSIAIVQSRSEN